MGVAISNCQTVLHMVCHVDPLIAIIKMRTDLLHDMYLYFFLSWDTDNLSEIYVIENSGKNSISIMFLGSY